MHQNIVIVVVVFLFCEKKRESYMTHQHEYSQPLPLTPAIYCYTNITTNAISFFRLIITRARRAASIRKSFFSLHTAAFEIVVDQMSFFFSSSSSSSSSTNRSCTPEDL